MRLRITFWKNENMRYIGHLDLHKAWERSFRRARLPLAYSQGFNPQPKMNLAAALPLGFTSQGEVGDFWLEEDLPLDELRDKLEPALPPGLELITMISAEPREDSLQSLVCAADYDITLLDPQEALEEKIEAILKADSLPRERRGKSYDLRPLIEKLESLPKDDLGRQRIFVRLTSLPGATGRPEELLDVLEVAVEAARVHRTVLHFNST